MKDAHSSAVALPLMILALQGPDELSETASVGVSMRPVGSDDEAEQGPLLPALPDQGIRLPGVLRVS